MVKPQSESTNIQVSQETGPEQGFPEEENVVIKQEIMIRPTKLQ